MSLERDRDADRGAAAALTLHLITAAQSLHALLHAADAEPGRRRGIDAAAVVAHGQNKLRCAQLVTVSLADPDRDALRRRVLDHVGQAFLYAAIDREIDRLAIARHQLVGAEGKADVGML